jgi:hypothetical protein
VLSRRIIVFIFDHAFSIGLYSGELQVDTPRIVAAAWLMLNVTAFALAA